MYHFFKRSTLTCFFVLLSMLISGTSNAMMEHFQQMFEETDKKRQAIWVSHAKDWWLPVDQYGQSIGTEPTDRFLRIRNSKTCEVCKNDSVNKGTHYESKICEIEFKKLSAQCTWLSAKIKELEIVERNKTGSVKK